MRASYSSRPDSNQPPARRRAVSLGLTIAAHLLIIYLLLHLGPKPPPPRLATAPMAAFRMLPDPEAAPTPSPRTPKVARVKQPSGGAAPRAPRPPAPPTTPPSAQPPAAFPAMLGGRELFQAADVAKLPTHAEDRQLAGGDSDGAGSGQGKSSGSTYGPDEGGGGRPRYDGEWFPPPTYAELAHYLPPSGIPQNASVVMDCQFAAGSRVENCRSVSESPLGSGLGRAMRQAAWQFHIRLRRNGRPIVGSWVRITMDFIDKGKE